jgi:ferredoxin
MGTTIFYFTGTGNSLSIAQDLAVALGDAKIVSIAKVYKLRDIDLSDDKIGFVFPMYYTGVPLLVVNFVKKLQIPKSKYVFAIANYGNIPMGTIQHFTKILNDKGLPLSAGFYINMPQNYIRGAAVQIPEEQKELFIQEKIKVHEIAKVISQRKAGVIEKGKLHNLHIVSSLFYRIKSSKIRKDAEQFLVKEACNGCGTCAAVCPVNNIELISGKPKWNTSCEQCLACLHWCPRNAIEFGRTTLNHERFHNPDISIKQMIDSAGKK